jgi:hypothetical protein
MDANAGLGAASSVAAIGMACSALNKRMRSVRQAFDADPSAQPLGAEKRSMPIACSLRGQAFHRLRLRRRVTVVVTP